MWNPVNGNDPFATAPKAAVPPPADAWDCVAALPRTPPDADFDTCVLADGPAALVSEPETPACVDADVEVGSVLVAATDAPALTVPAATLLVPTPWPDRALTLEPAAPFSLLVALPMPPACARPGPIDAFR